MIGMFTAADVDMATATNPTAAQLIRNEDVCMKFALTTLIAIEVAVQTKCG